MYPAEPVSCHTHHRGNPAGVQHLISLLALTISLSACSTPVDPIGETEGIWVLRTLGGAALPVADYTSPNAMGFRADLMSDTLILGGREGTHTARHIEVVRSADGVLSNKRTGGFMRGDVRGGNFEIDYSRPCPTTFDSPCVISFYFPDPPSMQVARRGDVLLVDMAIPGSGRVYHRLR